MAVVINARCTDCGCEVKLSPAAITLRISPTSFVSNYGGEAWGTYYFKCPLCGENVQRDADLRTIRLLTSGGVEPLPLAPAEFLEREKAADAPPITLDDLIDLHQVLEGDDAYDRIVGGMAS